MQLLILKFQILNKIEQTQFAKNLPKNSLPRFILTYLSYKSLYHTVKFFPFDKVVQLVDILSLNPKSLGWNPTNPIKNQLFVNQYEKDKFCYAQTGLKLG